MTNIVSMFDGISCARLAAWLAGIHVDNYVSMEVDKYAESIAARNFSDYINLGDVRGVSGNDFPFDTDLLIAGSPCQGFSLQGLQLGLEDPRSTLIHEFFRLLEEVQPKYFLLENVRMKKEMQAFISNKLGVPALEINTSLVLPQSRNRLYWTNIPQTILKQREYNIQDFILDGPGEPATTRKGPPRIVVPTEIFGCLTATYYKGIRADGRPSIASAFGEFDTVKEHVRMLSPRECEMIQGVPLGYTCGVSNTQRYKALGNGFSVPIIAHLLKHLAD